jgi:hypothetical protein
MLLFNRHIFHIYIYCIYKYIYTFQLRRNYYILFGLEMQAIPAFTSTTLRATPTASLNQLNFVK